MKRTILSATVPLPEKNFDLYYRGKKIESSITRAECIGVISDKMRTGCYLRQHFDIKPVTPTT